MGTSPEVATWYCKRKYMTFPLNMLWYNAIWVHLTWYGIPITWYYLGADPSPSPKYLPSTSGSAVSKLWIVLANSKWRACCWAAMVIARFWALWGNCVVLCRHSVLWLIELLWNIRFSGEESEEKQRLNSYLITDVMWELLYKLSLSTL